MFNLGASFNTSFSDISSGLFGDDFEGSTRQTETERRDLTTARGLDISEDAVTKILSDLLSGDLGIANIFTKENVSGLYDSTVAKRQADNFLASVIGELAKLQATEFTKEFGTIGTTGKTTQEKESPGLVGSTSPSSFFDDLFSGFGL